MKIAILGIRGIPNRHGGFDRAAEEISVRLARKGHAVTVYNTDDHAFKGADWRGVRIQRVFSRENSLGIFGTFIFDYLCLADAAKKDFDVIFEMGHYPAAIFFPLLKKSRAALVTNIDGLCWMRPKWSRPIRRFILECERIAVKRSDALIADHPEIRSYCLSRYGRVSQYIAYGAQIPSEDNTAQLQRHGLVAGGYYLLVARLEPENNIEMILDGYVDSGCHRPFVVVGDVNTSHARYLTARYRAARNVRFVGGIFDYEELSGLRKRCKLYFHGHSVGGTTPSLLEAMACEAPISAHDNRFNRGVLGQDALYFSQPRDVATQIRQDLPPAQAFQRNNLDKIRRIYDWDQVANEHERLFEDLVRTRRA